MRADSVNRWLTLGANFGVLIGIIVLLTELNQNSTMMRAQTRNEVTAGLIDLTSGIWNNSQFADVHRRGYNGEELTATERHQLNFHYLAVFRYFENFHYQYRQGLYDETEFSAHRKAYTDVMNSKLVVEFWCDYRDGISPEARADLDSLLTAYTC